MALTINTNLSSLIVQSNLQKSTKGLNDAIERMTTGYKINHAKDNAANYGISVNMETKMRAYQVAEDNVAMGLDMLNTKSEAMDLVNGHLTRIRDLTIQALNDTFDKSAIKAECLQRITEMGRTLNTTEYNGISLFNLSDISDSIILQIGIDSSDSSQVELGASDVGQSLGAKFAQMVLLGMGLNDWGKVLEYVDASLEIVSKEQTNIGAVQNRLESAAEQINVAYENLTSSHSTIKDSDVAKESSTYIKKQILQQASATLLATANQSPSLALQLI